MKDKEKIARLKVIIEILTDTLEDIGDLDNFLDEDLIEEIEALSDE